MKTIKNPIRIIRQDKTILVSKAFLKRANLFGTEESKMLEDARSAYVVVYCCVCYWVSEIAAAVGVIDFFALVVDVESVFATFHKVVDIPTNKSFIDFIYGFDFELLPTPSLK